MKKLTILFAFALFFTYAVNAQDSIQTVKKVNVSEHWARIDVDNMGTYGWIGGALNIGNLCIAHDAVINFPFGNNVLFEAGPYFSTFNGKLDLWPALGAAMDFTNGQTNYFVPELFIYSTFPRIYFEIWNQYYIGTSGITVGEELYYGRYIAKLSFGDFKIGPYAEMTYDIVSSQTLLMPIGLVFSYPYLSNGSFDIMLGKDLKTEAFSPRVTYIYRFK